jgi:hypothetical protein
MIRRIVLDASDLALLRLFIVNPTTTLAESSEGDPDRDHKERMLRLAQRLVGDVQ